LLATKELKIEAVTSLQERPVATHFVAGVGSEIVKFEPPVKLVGKAEAYLLSLLSAQVLTLSKCLTQSMMKYPQLQRVQWVTQKDSKTGDSADPAQIILLVAMVDFVVLVEKAMVKTSAGDAKSIFKCFDLIKSQLSDLINLTQAPLSKEDRQRVMCMITLDAHNRDIVDVLIKEKAFLNTDFQWQSKLRPKYIGDLKNNIAIVSNANFAICDARFDYGFEYLGNGPRLVVTPLTDRIYVTATQALHLKMGCAPAGIFFYIYLFLISLEFYHKFCFFRSSWYRQNRNYKRSGFCVG
jgi:dynein heavy chain